MIFDAFGRLVLGQLPSSAQNGQGNLTQAAGVGVARTLGAVPAQAIGIGVAGGLSGTIVSNPAVLFVGAAGIGVAGSLAVSDTESPSGASGIGAAGSLAGSDAESLTGVSGIGVAGQITVTISGGGTSRKPNAGLEPVKKRPPQPIKPLKAKIVLPPSLDISPPIAPAETSPIDHIEYAAQDLLSLEARIHEAMDATDIEHMLRHLDDEDERQCQDEADIADITAMLEMMSD